jgi:hypothetical protein
MGSRTLFSRCRWVVCLVCAAVALAACVSESARWEASKRKIADSVTSQLASSDRIKYADLARQAFADSGWHNEGLLELWLSPRLEGDRVASAYNSYRSQIFWLCKPAPAKEELVRFYAIVAGGRWGPELVWYFYVDADGYIRGYFDPGEASFDP